MKSLPRPTRRGLLVLVAGALLVVVGAASGFTDVVRAGIFVLVLALLAFLIAVAARIGRVDVTRHGPPERLSVGDEGQITLGVKARRAGWIETTLEEPHTFTRHGVARWPLSQVQGGRAAYDVTARHRGSFTSGPARLVASDPFGLFETSLEQGRASTWLVRAHTVSLETPQTVAQGDGDDTVISAHATHAGRPGASIREYVQGDDLRTVHWPATAHRGELMVRQFDPPAQPRIHVVVLGNVPRPGTNESWEWLISAAASACTELENHNLATLATVGEREYDNHDDILDALARAGESLPDRLTIEESPTLLFLHTSADHFPPAPHHSPAFAWVGGASAEHGANELTRLGWDAVGISPYDSIAESLYPAMSGGDLR